MNTIAGRIASDATYQATQMVQQPEKTCTKCGETKILREFPKAGYNSAKQLIYRSHCRDCYNTDLRTAILAGKHGKLCDTCNIGRYPGAFLKGSTTCQQCERKIAASQKRPELHWIFTKSWVQA